MTREEAIQILSTRDSHGVLCGYTSGVTEALDMAKKALSEPSIVRCGECEHWKCNPNTNEYGVCNKVSYDEFEVVMDADDFCSYGERREP